MIRLKCPLYKYGKGMMLRCTNNKLSVRTKFESRELLEEHREQFCMTMKYSECPFYNQLVKENQ